MYNPSSSCTALVYSFLPQCSCVLCYMVCNGLLSGCESKHHTALSVCFVYMSVFFHCHSLSSDLKPDLTGHVNFVFAF